VLVVPSTLGFHEHGPGLGEPPRVTRLRCFIASESRLRWMCQSGVDIGSCVHSEIMKRWARRAAMSFHGTHAERLIDGAREPPYAYPGPSGPFCDEVDLVRL